jgi:alkanesulfonate monooxygenase SsuD/methylene tetrahydromethanopterin reductase-like flavin-dependent oxidoreductase (luciferase family)
MLLATCTGIVPQGGKSAREGQHFGGVKDADRPSIMEENMRLCRALWSGEPIDFDGTFRSYEGLQVQPTPVQDPCPIWISANPNPGKYFARSMKRVATLGDGFQTVVLTPDRLRSMTTELRTHLLDAGRDPDSFPVMAYHNINIGADRDECLEESKRFLDAYYGPVFSMEVVESWTAAGTPEQCVDHLANLIDQGANAITLRCTSFDQLSQIERLTTEVLPAFG